MFEQIAIQIPAIGDLRRCSHRAVTSVLTDGVAVSCSWRYPCAACSIDYHRDPWNDERSDIAWSILSKRSSRAVQREKVRRVFLMHESRERRTTKCAKSKEKNSQVIRDRGSDTIMMKPPSILPDVNFGDSISRVKVTWNELRSRGVSAEAFYPPFAYNFSTSAGISCIAGRSDRSYLQQDTDFTSGTHLHGPSAHTSQSSSLVLICQTATTWGVLARDHRLRNARELTRLLHRSQPAFETRQSILHLLDSRHRRTLRILK